MTPMPIAEAAPRFDGLDSPHLIATVTYERPEAERPSHDTMENIAHWLVTQARRNPSFTRIIDELGWRLLATGIPLLRMSLHGGTLHPQFLGATYVWWRTTARTQKIMIAHELVDLTPYAQNPVRRVREGGEIMRRHLDAADVKLDFPILQELKTRGATDYFAFPVPSPFGFGVYMMGFVTDKPGGFNERETADLMAVTERLVVIADMNSQKNIAENVLSAYLGPRTGPRVLSGQIRRGGGQEISAVIWSSDLRGFTLLSDQLPGERVIEILNEIFDLQAKAISAHGGEILKFVGDGLLAIFPVANTEDATRAAGDALAAAREALAALAARVAPKCEPTLNVIVALHYGTVIYGNIGSADRLDFTVIGPAVNLVSRVEAVAKSRDLPLVVSDDFARVYCQPLPSLGMHQLRGLEQPHELFAPTMTGT